MNENFMPSTSPYNDKCKWLSRSYPFTGHTITATYRQLSSKSNHFSQLSVWSVTMLPLVAGRNDTGVEELVKQVPTLPAARLRSPGQARNTQCRARCWLLVNVKYRLGARQGHDKMWKISEPSSLKGTHLKLILAFKAVVKTCKD